MGVAVPEPTILGWPRSRWRTRLHGPSGPSRRTRNSTKLPRPPDRTALPIMGPLNLPDLVHSKHPPPHSSQSTKDTIQTVSALNAGHAPKGTLLHADSQANGHRDGIGKTSGLSRRLRARKCNMDPVRASPCRPAATINVPHQQAGHTKALDPTLEIGQGKITCRRGPTHTHNCPEQHVLLVDRLISLG